jgi:hypothetical protein
MLLASGQRAGSCLCRTTEERSLGCATAGTRNERQQCQDVGLEQELGGLVCRYATTSLLWLPAPRELLPPPVRKSTIEIERFGPT